MYLYCYMHFVLCFAFRRQQSALLHTYVGTR